MQDVTLDSKCMDKLLLSVMLITYTVYICDEMLKWSSSYNIWSVKLFIT